MPPRRITQAEYEGAAHMRDQIVTDFSDWCPKADIAIGFHPTNGGVDLSAEVTRDIAPLTREDVILVLADMGVKSISINIGPLETS